MQADLAAGHADLAVSQANRFPLPSISLNAARDTGNIRTLGPAVSFALPLWNRNRGDIAIAHADLQSREADYLARIETVRSDIASALSAFRIAKRQRADVTEDIEGLYHQADVTRKAAERGDLAETTAVATQMTALDRQILSDQLSLAAAEAAIALETAVGRPLDQIQ